MAGTGLYAVAQSVVRGEQKIEDVPKSVRQKVADIAKVIRASEPKLGAAPIKNKRAGMVRRVHSA